jgi:S-adenosylmethionine hydrolase
MPAFITMTTDYGGRDCFAASVKGVILTINPQTQIIDISNEISPQDIWEAAFILNSACNHFPKGTVHLAVVDPGVGTDRRPIIVVTDNYFFVGPDNGLFSLIYHDAERVRVHHITATHYFLPNPSPTFHGRDIFAPVAGWLAKGIPVENFGEVISDYVKLNIPAPKITPTGIEGHVVHIDRFGNIITDILQKEILKLLPVDGDIRTLSVNIINKEIKGLKNYYAEAAPGETGALINSSGALEIFVFKQNARTVLSVKRGESVRLTIV